MLGHFRLFISYARRDGEDFATRLRKRLEAEQPEITIWQDRARMEAGLGWWKQITDAIDSVDFMVLVMTPEAMKSETVRKEWRYARQQGVCVYPVKGATDSELAFSTLPRWMSKAHFFDLDREWDTFIHHIKGPCQATRIPFMAPDLPEWFVARPTEFDALKRYLLSPNCEDPVAITTALHGAGGFGKTTLAAALCHSDDVITAFDDGVLWLTLGKEPNVQAALTMLFAALTGERPGFVSQDDAALELANRLQGKNCLLVLDDLWNPAHARPFLQAAKTCGRLITTRQFELATDLPKVTVDQMTTSQAVQMLTAGLENHPAKPSLFFPLATRLGEWPLMLELARDALRQRVARGDTVEGALEYLNRALERRGVQAFDKASATERWQAIGRTIEVSLELLPSTERTQYIQLAVFPSDVEIPLIAIQALWNADEFSAEELVIRLDSLSLLRFDLQRGTIRLHSVMRGYIAEHLPNPSVHHERLLDTIGEPRNRGDSYLWHWIGYHLVKAGRSAVLQKHTLDLEWISRKLDATDVAALVADYDFLPSDPDLQSVQSAIRLAAHILAQDKAQLSSQLTGRLMTSTSPNVQTMLRQAVNSSRAPWVRPCMPSLTPPGGPLLRTLRGHRGMVNCVAVIPGSRRVVSGSHDHTLRVWDIDTGVELLTLKGHKGPVYGVAITPDGRQGVSCGADRKVLAWDLESGSQLRVLGMHSDRANAVAITPNGLLAISGSADGALKVWDLHRHSEVRSLQRHSGAVTAVTALPDSERILSASRDGTVKLSNIITGEELRVLHGHSAEVSAVVATKDGTTAVSASWDYTLRRWSVAEGRELDVLSGHSGFVNAVALTPDGRCAISGAWDQTLRIWDLGTGKELRTLRDHMHDITSVAVTEDGLRAVSASWDQTLKVWDLGSVSQDNISGTQGRDITATAISPDGRTAICGCLDGTLRIWDLSETRVLLTIPGHRRGITSVAFSQDLYTVVSASYDRAIKVWNTTDWSVRHALRGHGDWVTAVAMSPNGHLMISGAGDGTLRIWDLHQGGVSLLDFKGHDWVVSALAITSDGKHAISGSWDHAIKMWNIETGKEVRKFQGHSDRVSALAITPDQHWLLSGSWDRTLRIWDVQTGTELRALRGHVDRISGIAICSDGRYAVSASWDHSLKFWDLQKGRLVAGFTADAPLEACAATCGGITAIAGDGLGRLHMVQLLETKDQDSSPKELLDAEAHA